MNDQHMYDPYNRYGNSQSDYGQSGSNYPPPPPPYDNPYPDSNPYDQPIQPESGSYQYERLKVRKRRAWPFVLLALLLVVACVAGSTYGIYQLIHASFSQAPTNPFSPGSNNGLQNTQDGPTIISVGPHPTIVIDRNNGSIHVKVNSNNSTITIQAIDTSTSTPPTIPYTKSENTITFNTTSAETDEVDLTVPSTADLQLSTNDGDIVVTGVSGQMTLSSNAGAINVSQCAIKGHSKLDTNGAAIQATQVSLSGTTTLSTNAGNITLSGMLDRHSTLVITNNTGVINVTLPADAAFHVDATSSAGTITSEFPSIQVTLDISGGEAHGDVGNPPRATIHIDTNDGQVHLHKK